MLARGNGDGAERVVKLNERKGGWRERQYRGKKGRRRSRERSEIPAVDGREGHRLAWLKRGSRRRRQRPRPCCIYHIITIIELRAALRQCRPIPPAFPVLPSRNRKLETLEYIFPSSLVHSPCSKLFAVGRRDRRSRKDANDSNADALSLSVAWKRSHGMLCYARGWSTHGH